MNLCPFCGAPLTEGGRFCPRCGAEIAALTPPTAPEPPAFAPENPDFSAAYPAVVPEPEPAPEKDASALVPLEPDVEAARSRAFAELRMHLHQESKAWRFYAIGALVIMMSLAGFFLFVGLMAGSFSFDGGEFFDGALVSGIVVGYGLFLSLLILPVVIVGFVMGSKVLRYYEQAATNCENALKHAGSVGVIVLAAIFSTPALIFVIINFVKTKKHRAELEAVLARQKTAGAAFRNG